MIWLQSFLLFLFKWDEVLKNLRRGVLTGSFPSFAVVELPLINMKYSKDMILYFLQPTFSVLLPDCYLDLFFRLIPLSLSSQKILLQADLSLSDEGALAVLFHIFIGHTVTCIVSKLLLSLSTHPLFGAHETSTYFGTVPKMAHWAFQNGLLKFGSLSHSISESSSSPRCQKSLCLPSASFHTVGSSMWGVLKLVSPQFNQLLGL